MSSKKSGVLLLELHIEPVMSLPVWVESEFLQAEYLGLGRSFSVSPILQSTCVQLWISTKLAILNQ